MSEPFARTKLVGYDVQERPEGGWLAFDLGGDELPGPMGGDAPYPIEEDAWIACDNHRMFGSVLELDAPGEPEPPKPEACGECRFGYSTSSDLGLLYCRRRAPITCPVDDRGQAGDRVRYAGFNEPIWPTLRASQWCGDFEWKIEQS